MNETKLAIMLGDTYMHTYISMQFKKWWWDKAKYEEGDTEQKLIV